MDLQTRKLNFIQEFLRLNNEKLISKLENLLKSEIRNQKSEIRNPQCAATRPRAMR
jgi:hypothetical protein